MCDPHIRLGLGLSYLLACPHSQVSCPHSQVSCPHSFIPPGPIRDEWLASASHLGKIIKADIGREQYEGYFESVDENGNLVLLTTGGKRVIPAADIYF